MTCNEAENLFVSGAFEPLARKHAESCPACAAALRDHEEIGLLASYLSAPVWSQPLRETLLSVPARTVSCELADEILAGAMEGGDGISAADRLRVDFHLSRCESCAEAARTLLGVRELAAPQPAPWLNGRIAASAPKRPAQRKRGAWAWLLDPKAAIVLAYAAAITVLFLGFNPADLARKARTDLPQEAKSAVADAKTTLADHIGALEEKAVRATLVVRSRVFGYGRAALSNAVTLVLKSEPARTPSRPRSGEQKGAVPRSETSITTWRA